MNASRYWREFVLWALLLLAAYAFWRWMATYVLPFVLAGTLAWFVLPLVERLEDFGLGRVWAVLLSLGGVMATLVVLSGAILLLLTAELVQASHRLPTYLKSRPFGIAKAFHEWNRLRDQLGLGRGSFSQEINSLYRMLTVVVKSVGHLLVVLPEMALMMVVAVVAAFFILRDYPRILTWMRRISPPALRRSMGRFTTMMAGGLWGYVRAELALVSLTALTTAGGLLLIRAPYAVLVGLMAGLLDLVSFMGPTIVLVPWAAGAAVAGHWPLSIHLLLVLAAVAVVRQLSEPRLVGQGTGLHPLVVLFSLYMGIRLFGGVGVIVGPVTAVILNAVRQVRDRA
nr:AI-2E family transporter [Sulfobacillus harzensis]